MTFGYLWDDMERGLDGFGQFVMTLEWILQWILRWILHKLWDDFLGWLQHFFLLFSLHPARYSRVWNKRRGTFINFWEKSKKNEKWKMTAMPWLMLRLFQGLWKFEKNLVKLQCYKRSSKIKSTLFFIVMSVHKNPKKCECWKISRQYSETVIEFYRQIYPEKDRFNFGTYWKVLAPLCLC